MIGRYDLSGTRWLRLAAPTWPGGDIMHRNSGHRRVPAAVRHTGRSALVLAALAAAMLAGAVPAAADDPFGFLEDALEGAGDAIEGAADALTSPDQPESSVAPAGATDTGVAPTAVVEEAAGVGTPGIAEFTYLQPGQKIELGSKGSLRLTYFSSCTVETIRGGTVTIGTVASEVSGGKVERSTSQCQAQEVAGASSATEFGASVKRVTPYDPNLWAEATVSTQKPSFSWGGGSATLRLVELDAAEPRVAWEGKVKGPVAAFPKGAAPLAVGMPYRVEIDSGGTTLAAVFSVDPGFTSSNGKVDVVAIAR